MTSNFELIGGVAVVETSCLSSSGLRSLFTRFGLHACLLFILAFRPLHGPTKGRSQTCRSLVFRYPGGPLFGLLGLLCFVTLGAPCLDF